MQNLKLQLVALFSLVSFAGVSHAAVPAEATTAITDLIADATTWMGSLWPLVVVITVGFIFIKLFKRGANRAT